jgi:very-short-patch-repair endonuclease
MVVLDREGVRWERNRQAFPYNFNGVMRNYFPDFYLPDVNLLIEVKGRVYPQDTAKWAAVSVVVVYRKDLEVFEARGLPQNWRAARAA